MKRGLLDYLDDILDAMSSIEAFTEAIEYEAFVNDKKTSYAVVRGLEIIGEAVKKLPDEMKQEYPDIPWREIAGMRDKLIHEYFGIDLRVVWTTATKDIPQFRPLFQEIKNRLEKE